MAMIAVAGVDMAAWDALARAAGVPLCPASKAMRFHAGKTVKDTLNPPRSVGNKKSARPKRSAAPK
jgi:L-alanine-DL-glutamate epimerase-like enolase superfamily enzyme